MRADLINAALWRALVLCVVVLPLQAQDTNSLRNTVRSISRNIELGNVPTVRQQLRADPAPRDARAALEHATFQRLSFQTARAERSYRSLLGNSSATVRAHALAGLAQLFAQSARYGDAAALFASAGTQFAALGDSAGISESYLGLSQALLRTGGVTASRTALVRAEAFAPRSDTLIRVNLACSSLMLRVRAADAVLMPFFIKGRRESHDVSARAESLCLLAQIEFVEGRGDLAVALAALDTLAALQQRASLTSGLSATRQRQGWILLSLGSYGDARSALEEAIRLGDSTGTLSSAGWANNALADLAQRVGSWSDGAAYARRAEVAFGRARDGPGLVSARVLSASVALAAGDLERASRTLEGMQRDMLALFPRTAVEVLAMKSDIARRRGDPRQAALLLDSAELFGRRLDLLAWNNDLKYRRAMLAISAGRFADARRRLTAMLDGDPTLSPLLRYQLLARLSEVAAREGALPRARELLERALFEMDRWRATLADRGLRLAASQTRGLDWDADLDVATVIATIARQGDGSAALALADKRRARVLFDESARRRMLVENRARPDWMLVADVSRRSAPLAANTAIISYTTGNGGEPTTMIISTTGRTTAVVTIAADSIVDVVRRFVAFLAAGHLARPASRRLAQLLIDPALPLLPPSITRLIIVPDGSIHRVPFAALLLPDDTFLAQRFEVVTAPSVAIALHGLGRSPRSGELRGGVLAFGAPTSPKRRRPGPSEGPVLDLPGTEWPPLPGARDEMHGIARIVSGTEVIEGAAASYAGLRNAARQPGPVLHLATHARAVEYSLMSGAMLLAPEGGHQREVTAPEIAAMTLPFDLVVLSACESGGGSLLIGEGLQGIATAFLEAGARSVLATRWRLEDRDTRTFLDGFYRSLIDGRDAAGALADARRLAISRDVSPAVWANFELIGDPAVAPNLSAARAWPRSSIVFALFVFFCLLAYGARLVSRRRL